MKWCTVRLFHPCLPMLIALALPAFAGSAADTTLVWEDISIRGDIGEILALAVGHDGDLFAGTFAGVFRSTNAGTIWTLAAALENSAASALAIGPDGTIYAGTNDGMFFSTDNGDSWRRTVSQLRGTFIIRLAVSSRGDVVAATGSGLILQSSDSGRNWKRIAELNSFNTLRDLQMSRNDLVFYATSRVVARMVNDGMYWDAKGFYLYERAISSFALDSGDNLFVNSTWQVTSTGGVYRAGIGFDDWIPAGLEGIAGMSIAVDARGRLLAGSVKDGLFRSSDGGMTWSELDFPGSYVSMIAFGPDERIYAVSSGNSIFRSAIRISGVHSPRPVSSATHMIGATPNPATGAAAVRFRLAQRAHARVMLFDMRGEPVAEILDEMLPSGEHVRSFDAGNLPAGMYYCRLVADGRISSIPLVVAR